ncbi:beta-1,3-galactosyltransferase brn [Neodiprion virginianus]|uniref:beta-1,3-galactosyltransferase brn n=1 Tax=Neodiprion virginianus TaxID=2961670 RepID=UPI001EE7177D|nr:beta-1,3-galactosyltransferase brn [Neodiprion virginianus]
MFCILQPLLRKLYILLSRIKIKYVCFGFIVIATLDFFGVFHHAFETSYHDSFTYPYYGEIHEFVAQLRNNEKPDVEPINDYNYTFIYDLKEKCIEYEHSNLRLVFLVKSAVNNFDRRIGIRNSWGFEKRFSDVPIKTVFLVGRSPGNPELEARLKAEAIKHKDIVLIDFIDTYFNNTIKTMMGFKWAVKYCQNSKFYMFVDDDMYVSLKNVLRYVRHPTGYPDYLKDPKGPEHLGLSKGSKKHLYARMRRATVREKIIVRKKPGWILHNKTLHPSAVGISRNRTKRQIFDIELPEDVRLFTGYVFVSAPHRHRTSKWYVSLDEYPYHLWPPYVTAGAYILSKEALLDMYYASFYTKHFRFDDIYLGLVAKKIDIEPFHCDDFHFYKKDYTKYNYKYVIASHGYGDPNELLRVWNEQKALGYA